MHFQHPVTGGTKLPNVYKTTHANITFTKSKLSGKQKKIKQEVQNRVNSTANFSDNSQDFTLQFLCRFKLLAHLYSNDKIFMSTLQST